MSAPARIPPGGFKELGPINWAIAKLGARGIRAPKFHLFNVLGQHKLLFLAWLPFSGYLLYAGKLSRTDAELVILRVGHLRDCEYELQQHRRLAKSRGVDADLQARIFEGRSCIVHGRTVVRPRQSPVRPCLKEIGGPAC